MAGSIKHATKALDAEPTQPRRCRREAGRLGGFVNSGPTGRSCRGVTDLASDSSTMAEAMRAAAGHGVLKVTCVIGRSPVNERQCTPRSVLTKTASIEPMLTGSDTYRDPHGPDAGSGHLYASNRRRFGATPGTGPRSRQGGCARLRASLEVDEC